MADEKVTAEVETDEEFLKKLEGVLGQWRSDVLATVKEMVSTSVAATKETKEDKPEKISQTAALRSELENLKAELKAERLGKSLTELGGKHNLHADLLELVVKSKGELSEVDGKFYLKDGESLKSLDTYVETFVKTPEGQRLVKQDRGATPLGFSKVGQQPNNNGGKVDAAQLLFDSL